MKSSLRGLRHIRTLGRRGTAGSRQSALLKASIVEAELQRLRQEKRRLEDRVAQINESVAILQAERDRLVGALDVRHGSDRSAGSSRQTFHLRY